MFSRPATAGPQDRKVGEDELGNPLFETMLGHQYTVKPDTSGSDRQRMVAGALLRSAQAGAPFEPGLVGAGEGPGVGDVLGGRVQGAVQGITAPGRALRGEPVTMEDVWATALDWGAMGAPMRAPEGALRAGAGRTGKGIRAYHGSPHDFDRFSMDKIGTGEGSGLAGKGLYFAEDEALARSYKDNLRMRSTAQDAAQAGRLDDFEAGLRKRLDDINSGQMHPVLAAQERKAIQYDLRDVERVRRMTPEQVAHDGSLYEVRINAHPDDFVDLGADPSASAGNAARSAGAPGATFMDRGTRNYVVFDDSLIEIVRKYGIAGAAMLTGMTAAEIQAGLGDAQAAGETQAEAIRQYLQGAQ